MFPFHYFRDAAVAAFDQLPAISLFLVTSCSMKRTSFRVSLEMGACMVTASITRNDGFL